VLLVIGSTNEIPDNMSAFVAALLVNDLVSIFREHALLALAPLGSKSSPLRELYRVRQELLDLFSRLLVRPLLLLLNLFHLSK
jgi:hypothetical protein